MIHLGRLLALLGILGATACVSGIVLAVFNGDAPAGILCALGVLLSIAVGIAGLLLMGLHILATMDD